MEDINKKAIGDYGHSVLKVALGTVPIVGVAASELLNLLVIPPL